MVLWTPPTSSSCPFVAACWPKLEVNICLPQSLGVVHGSNYFLHLLFWPMSLCPIFYSTSCPAPPRRSEKILLIKNS